MRYKYYYYQFYNQKLRDVLDKYRIRYQVIDETHLTPKFINFSFYSTSANATEIVDEIAKISRYEPIITIEYTALEIADAEWLWIWPKKQSIEILNEDVAYLSTCKYTDFTGKVRVRHQIQQNLFMIKKEPTIGKQTAFWTQSTGFAEIFTDFRVHDLIEENSLSGIELKNVVLKNGDYSNKVYQLTAKYTLERQCIGTGYGEKRECCKYCGNEQFVIDSAYQLHVDYSKINQNNDIYVTERIFGEGIAYPLYIISQRFYKLLEQEKLLGGLKVSPVINLSVEIK